MRYSPYEGAFDTPTSFHDGLEHIHIKTYGGNETNDTDTYLYAHKSPRWYASWLFVFAFLPIFFLYFVFVPYSICAGVDLERSPLNVVKQAKEGRRQVELADADTNLKSSSVIMDLETQEEYLAEAYVDESAARKKQTEASVVAHLSSGASAVGETVTSAVTVTVTSTGAVLSSVVGAVAKGADTVVSTTVNLATTGDASPREPRVLTKVYSDDEN